MERNYVTVTVCIQYFAWYVSNMLGPICNDIVTSSLRYREKKFRNKSRSQADVKMPPPDIYQSISQSFSLFFSIEWQQHKSRDTVRVQCWKDTQGGRTHSNRCPVINLNKKRRNSEWRPRKAEPPTVSNTARRVCRNRRRVVCITLHDHHGKVFDVSRSAVGARATCEQH